MEDSLELLKVIALAVCVYLLIIIFKN